MEKMLRFFSEDFGNASALHKEGKMVKEVIEDMRSTLAYILKVRTDEVFFTSGGTEANNLMLFGIVESLKKEGKDGEILILETEHPSIREACNYLTTLGVKVRYVPVDENGLINTQELRTLLSKKTILLSLAYANSETGVVQDIKQVTRIIRNYEKEQNIKIYIHTDASQAALWLPCGIDSLGVDFMTLDSGKCYGPKGFGVLIKKHYVSLTPRLYGGGQEYGLRAGTENTPLIIGGVEALRIAQQYHKERSDSVKKIRDFAIVRLQEEFPNIMINGSMEWRIANNINISFPGMDTEYAAVYLDTYGIAVSTRSACGSVDTVGSYVVRAMTHDTDRARSTLRITLGEETKKSDIEQCITILHKWHQMMKMIHNPIPKPVKCFSEHELL